MLPLHFPFLSALLFFQKSSVPGKKYCKISLPFCLPCHAICTVLTHADPVSQSSAHDLISAIFLFLQRKKRTWQHGNSIDILPVLSVRDTQICQIRLRMRFSLYTCTSPASKITARSVTAPESDLSQILIPVQSPKSDTDATCCPFRDKAVSSHPDDLKLLRFFSSADPCAPTPEVLLSTGKICFRCHMPARTSLSKNHPQKPAVPRKAADLLFQDKPTVPAATLPDR